MPPTIKWNLSLVQMAKREPPPHGATLLSLRDRSVEGLCKRLGALATPLPRRRTATRFALRPTPVPDDRIEGSTFVHRGQKISVDRP